MYTHTMPKLVIGRKKEDGENRRVKKDWQSVETDNILLKIHRHHYTYSIYP